MDLQYLSGYWSGKGKFIGCRHPTPTWWLFTPDETIQKLCLFVKTQDLELFRSTVTALLKDLGDSAAQELVEVMTEAIDHDDGLFASELLRLTFFPPGGELLGYAVVKKAKNVITAYIDAGWDINKQVTMSEPPALAFAVHDEELATWLLDLGADPNKKGLTDVTPLSYAVQLAPMSLVQRMLSHGGDVRKGQLLQNCMFRKDGLLDMISLLVSKGAPMDAPMWEDGSTFRCFRERCLGTALHTAAELGKLDAIRHLINLGASMDIKDAHGRTVLEFAKYQNLTDVIPLLESLGAHEKRTFML